jgi:phosphatidylglycerophosphatase C
MLAPMQIQTAEDVWARIASEAATQGRGAVATDADGTLWSGDVGEDLFHAFIDRGTVHPVAFEALRREARDHALSDAGTGLDVARRINAAYEAGHFPEERVFEIMAWCFAGWTRAEVAAFARETVERAGLKGRMHRETLHVLERAREAGLEVVLVSASPVAVVQAGGALAGLGDSHVVAVCPRHEGDVMLAEVDRPIPYGAGKVARLREYLGDSRPLLAAFGDNAYDVAMLASARVGVAVRPKPRLRERAGEVAGLVELAPEVKPPS